MYQCDSQVDSLEVVATEVANKTAARDSLRVPVIRNAMHLNPGVSKTGPNHQVIPRKTSGSSRHVRKRFAARSDGRSARKS